MEGESFPADNGFIKIVRRGHIGICAAINAFNGPLVMVAFKTAPCLAAGNTMVMKASEKTPLSTIFFAKLATEAGVPPGVFNIVNGPRIHQGPVGVSHGNPQDLFHRQCGDGQKDRPDGRRQH